jgi:hypothetical protein
LYFTASCGGASLERAADPLHGVGIDPELLSNHAHARPATLSQSGLDLGFQLGAIVERPAGAVGFFTFNQSPEQPDT